MNGRDHVERPLRLNDNQLHVRTEDSHQLHRTQVDDGHIVLRVHPVDGRQRIRRLGDDGHGVDPCRVVRRSYVDRPEFLLHHRGTGIHQVDRTEGRGRCDVVLWNLLHVFSTLIDRPQP